MVYAHDQRLRGHSSEIETNIDPLNICPFIDHNQKNRGAHNLANKLFSGFEVAFFKRYGICVSLTTNVLFEDLWLALDRIKIGINCFNTQSQIFRLHCVVIAAISVALYQNTDLSHSDTDSIVVNEDSQIFGEFLGIVWGEKWRGG